VTAPQTQPVGTAAAPRVAILLGSDSDLPVMRKCLEQLERLEVPFDIVVASAHRTPDRVSRYVERWERNGVVVFICAAGGAAHLAGAVAAKTCLPVLGVPLAVPPLDGVDALHATVQMPPGIPVATLAVGEFGAANAGILAAQIVSLTDPALKVRILRERENMRTQVIAKNARLRATLGLPAEEE
jgi:phosphoribosylaminoimidazole carboxylase PurE protein